MTDKDSAPDPTAAPEPRVQTLRYQKLVNRLTRGMLATPLVSRLIGRYLITVYVVGRKSGHRYCVPVAYVADGDGLLVGTPFAWARNLATGEPVDVRYLGRRRRAEVEVFTEEADVLRHYATIARNNHNFANFNRIRIDADGNPDPQDLRLAYQGGARVVRLTVAP